MLKLLTFIYLIKLLHYSYLEICSSMTPCALCIRAIPFKLSYELLTISIHAYYIYIYI